jgi:fermentation-respiration switch protein FrsA (DUF1100 family)
MKTLFSCLFALFAPIFVCLGAAPEPYAPPAPELAVATLKLEWQDATRHRAIPVKLYFPKEGAGPFPIIIFSHGLGGSRDGYEYLGNHWAGCGYVSVHLQHPGSDDTVWKDVPVAERLQSMQKAGKNLVNAVNRPLDVKSAIDQLERLNADPASPLCKRLDLARIGISGHSFGGYTTLAASGMTYAAARGINQLADPRLKAAIQMSGPASRNRADLDKVYGSIPIPMMHMTGTLDFSPIFPDTTAADRRIPFDHMGNSETCLVTFTGGDHMVFSGGTRALGGDRSKDPLFQKLICAGTTAFWDAYLKDKAEAKTWLLQGGYAKQLGDNAVFEKKAPGKALGPRH